MAYALADKKYAQMTPEEQQQAGGSRKAHKEKKAAHEAAKEKAQAALNTSSASTQDPTKFPDGSPRDPVTGNAPTDGTITSGDISYNPSTAGKPRFDAKDIKELKNQGYDDNQISEYAQAFDRDQIGAAAQVKTGMYLPEDVSNLDNYDPMSIGNTRVAAGKDQKGADIQKSELKYLMEEGGHSAYDLNEWAKANDYSLGGKAQKFLNNKLNLPTTDVTAPPDEEPEINTNPNVGDQNINVGSDNSVGDDNTIGDGNINTGGGDFETDPGDDIFLGDGDGDDRTGIGEIGDGSQVGVGENINQVGGDVDDSVFVAGDNEGQIANNGGVAMGDNSNLEQNLGNTRGDTNSNFTMGDGSWFIGNNNQGADYSVVIGNQNVGGTGTFVPGYTTGLNNMQGAAGYSALNDNAFLRSQSMMSGLGRASQASAAAAQMTGANERIAGFDFAARSTADRFRDMSQAQGSRYLGPTELYTPPAFVMPDPLRQVTPDYLNDEDEDR